MANNGDDDDGSASRRRVKVRLRLERTLLEQLQELGPDWEREINQILREALDKRGRNGQDG